MSDESRGLTKWQLALAVGAGAVAVVGVSALAYAVLRRRKLGGGGGSADPVPEGEAVSPVGRNQPTDNAASSAKASTNKVGLPTT